MLIKNIIKHLKINFMKNIITKIVSNNVSQIVKKKPNKSELRSYLNHMLFFDNLGNDSYGFKMNCEIFKVYNFICSEFIPEFYSTDHVDTFLDPYSASKYHQVMSIV